MYAVIETGGKQYKVSPGDFVEVERLPDEAGEPVEFPVLFYSNGDDIRCGKPTLPEIRVIGSVARHLLGKKVVAYTYKRRGGYHRKKGHRQVLTRVTVERIVAS
jgi:large subunit ribosomal protein L21